MILLGIQRNINLRLGSQPKRPFSERMDEYDIEYPRR